MKKSLILLFVLSVCAGCNKKASFTKEFTHTGCSQETKADQPFYFMPPAAILILKYEGGDLRVTRKNVNTSCGIKNEGGLICESSVEGADIYYKIYETAPANCICIVEEMSSAISGLKVGKEYQFHLNNYVPFTFTFSKNLFLVQDEASFYHYL